MSVLGVGATCCDKPEACEVRCGASHVPDPPLVADVDESAADLGLFDEEGDE